MKLIAGLGNPGPKYAPTRHNIGFLAAEALARDFSISLKRRGYQGVYGAGRIAGQEVTILLPQAYMNKSGVSVTSACKSLGIPPRDLIVIHDDIDLPFGLLRIKSGGGHGGHNGIRSIRELLGDGGFVRIRLGIGRPETGGDVSGYVLGPFSSEQRRKLEDVTANSARVVETILASGVQHAMNEFNNRNLF